MAKIHACPHCAGAGRVRDAAALTGPEAVASLLAPFARRGREHFICVFLDTRNNPIGRPYVVSVGSINASIVHPRETFREAIRRGAAGLIVAHNHPSGDPSPSEDDLAITRRLEEVGEVVGIPLVDALIVARRGYWSWKELQPHGLARDAVVSVRESGPPIRTSRARLDEYCADCAYPFDTGDVVYFDPEDPNETPYCSRHCLRRARNLPAAPAAYPYA